MPRLKPRHLFLAIITSLLCFSFANVAVAVPEEKAVRLDEVSPQRPQGALQKTESKKSQGPVVKVRIPSAMLELGKLPTSMEEFSKVKEDATSPEKAVLALITSMLVVTVNKELGLEMLATMGHPNADFMRRGRLGIRARETIRRLEKDGSRIIRSYIQGTTPPDYNLPTAPQVVHLSVETREEDVQVFIQSTGAQSWRPVVVRKVEGGEQWLITSMGSLITDVRSR